MKKKKEKTETQRGPKGSWEKLVERYRNLSYPYQRVVLDVLKPMISESNKAFLNRKIIRKICHDILQTEMQKKGMSYTQLFDKLNEKQHLQLNVKTYESFRKDKTINSYLFKDACDILGIPYTEKKGNGKNNTEKSYIILQALCTPVKKTDKCEIVISVPDKKSLEKMKEDEKWDDKKITYVDKKISVVGYYSDFICVQDILSNNIEWIFKLLNTHEKKIIEELLNSLQFLEVENSIKK